MSFFGSSGNKLFEKLLEKATSPLQLETDWQTILQMCDVIRGGDAVPKSCVMAIRKKLANENVNVVMYALYTLESVVKNCGTKVHQEVTTKEFMDQMKALATTKGEPVRGKVLELIQCWSMAFRKNPNYKIVEDYYNQMKYEGLQFPVLKEADAMFDVEQAPEWKDDTNCYRCRAEFSTIRRKHHCRCCGQIFCAGCSSKTSAIPKFGIEKEVRVCDFCYDKLKSNTVPNQSSSSQSDETVLPVEYVNSPLFKQNQAPARQEKTDEEFEEELQLALALSQSEQEEKEKKKKQFSGGSARLINNFTNNDNKSTTASTKNTTNSNIYNSTTTASITTSGIDDSESELNKFLARSAARKAAANQEKMLQQQQQQQQQISNPSPPPSAPYVETRLVEENSNIEQSKDENEAEMNVFVDELKKLLEIFVTRMRSDSLRGRTITNDTAVQSLFLQLQQLHPKLLSYVKYKEDERGYFESLQDKLTQLKDAREALNALRHDHFEKKRREAEERERIRQSQISQKLQHMRQQKQFYYQYQNEMNLRRLQEQEREVQMRLEQQRQLVMMRDQQFNNGLPFNTNPYEPQQQQQQYAYQLPQTTNTMSSQLPTVVSTTMGPAIQQQQPIYTSAGQMNNMPMSGQTMSNQPQTQNPSYLTQNPYTINPMNMSMNGQQTSGVIPQQQMTQAPIHGVNSDPKLSQYSQQMIQQQPLVPPQPPQQQQQQPQWVPNPQIPMHVLPPQNQMINAQPYMMPPYQQMQQPPIQQQHQQPPIQQQQQQQPPLPPPQTPQKSEPAEAQLISFD